MPDVKTNATMPKGESNGLAAIAGELVAEGLGDRPIRLRAVLCLVDVRRVSTDADTGDQLASVRFRRVEVLLPGDFPEAEKLIRRALEHRTGATVLPLDLENELADAFKDFDPDEPDPDKPIDLVPDDDDDDQGDEPGPDGADGGKL